jgi:hypothetical protein
VDRVAEEEVEVLAARAADLAREHAGGHGDEREDDERHGEPAARAPLDGRRWRGDRHAPMIPHAPAAGKATLGA